MENLDCRKLFDIGAKITLSSDFISRTYSSTSWEQDCINVQKKQGSLEILEVKPVGIYIAGTKVKWYLEISNINLPKVIILYFIN